MAGNEPMQLLVVGSFFYERKFYHLHIAEEVEVLVLVPYISNTTTHTGGEVATHASQDDSASAGHILAAVVAGALDNSYRTAVAHAEALTYPAVDIDLTRRSSVEQGVAGNDICLGLECRAFGGNDNNLSS